MRILVSGFEPFLDERVNPTEMLVQYANSCDFHRVGLSKLDVRGVVLPVLFDEAFLRLESERKLFQPDVVICFGLAGGRMRFEIEMLAVNARGGDQSQRGDNAGRVPTGKVSEAFEAPLVLPTTLPVTKILSSLEAESIPAGRSWTAGTYVCNDLFYQVQDRLRFTRVRSGFVHVPRLDDKTFTWPVFETAFLSILQNV